MKKETVTAGQKALDINLDSRIFGTFAEIGAGQEVARQFFRVGGAAGTIAKSMSAYDMTFSDAIYGRSGRYVSYERLLRMLEHEYTLLLQRLSEKRGADTTFFAFANTVAAKSFSGKGECHGWMGIRFQEEPVSGPSNIVLHVRMLDRENVSQQQALGTFGVNLMHAAFYDREDPDAFLDRLLDDLSIERIEVDMIEFSGPAFSKIDNRLMALKLVQKGLTDATMFSPDGKVLQPSEVLYKKPILVQRGSFRPITHVNVDMLYKARDEFFKIPDVQSKDPVILFEMTVKNLLQGDCIDEQDFIDRADSLSALGNIVMISDFSEHYRLPQFFRRYSQEPIAMVGGMNALLQVLDENFYDHLPGGILEALGRLFSKDVNMYIYPMSREGYLHYIKCANLKKETLIIEDLPEIISASEIKLPSQVRELHRHLINSKSVIPLENDNASHLDIFSREVLQMIQSGDPAWRKHVPEAAARLIEKRSIFDCKALAVSSPSPIDRDMVKH